MCDALNSKWVSSANSPSEGAAEDGLRPRCCHVMARGRGAAAPGLEWEAEVPKDAFSRTWYLLDSGFSSGSGLQGTCPAVSGARLPRAPPFGSSEQPNQTYPCHSTGTFFHQRNKHCIWPYARACISPHPSISVPCSLLKPVFCQVGCGDRLECLEVSNLFLCMVYFERENTQKPLSAKLGLA